MPTSDPRNLVSTEWLAQHLDAPDVRVVDASWYLPGVPRDPRAEYAERHIPGAVFFDIDEISDTTSPYPHMLPSPEKFSARVRKMGLGDGNRIVIYDGTGVYSAPRVWWMFRVFGHKDVAVLDGGLPKWIAEGRPVTDREPMPRERHFTARFDNSAVRTVDDMVEIVRTRSAQILDARTPGRVAGREAEPRPGLRAGHIPGSTSLPWQGLVNEDGTLKDAAGLKAAFEGAGVDTSKPIATTCGSGISAAILALGLDVIGARRVGVYDGSWAEWGARKDLPIEQG